MQSRRHQEHRGGRHCTRIRCYVKLTYTHSDRESHEETPATAYRVYTFTWADGWKVSASADSTEEAYNTASMDALP